MTHGLVIGKFLPLHRGHVHLLEAAAAECERVSVIVCDAGWHDLSPELRGKWIGESLPSAHVAVVDQDAVGLGDDDSEGWASATRKALGSAPDVVFSSEDYGPVFSHYLGARHVMVDRNRENVPIRAADVRADPLANLDAMPPHVRSHFVKRVCVIGAESTGKSTLATDLAENLDAVVVPEFGRFYTEAMPDPSRYRWDSDDFSAIARTQASFEDDAARWSGPVLVCDTNPFVTSVFREAYLGVANPALSEWTRRRRYDLFLLCDLRTPFEQDGTGLRHNGVIRERMQKDYTAYAAAQAGTLVTLQGDRQTRLRAATSAVLDLLR